MSANDFELYLDRAYLGLVAWPAAYQRVKDAGSLRGISGLLEQYIEELDTIQGIGPNSNVRKLESADARAYLKSLEPPIPTAEETEVKERTALVPLVRLAHAILPDCSFASVIGAWDEFGNAEMLAHFVEEAQSVCKQNTVNLFTEYRACLFDDSKDAEIVARVEKIRRWRQ